MEDAVEGSLRRVFPTTIQPVQLAKAAARAMEEAQLIGLHGAEVPNSYRLRLAPADLERFADYRVTLARELNASTQQLEDRRQSPHRDVAVAAGAHDLRPQGARGRRDRDDDLVW